MRREALPRRLKLLVFAVPVLLPPFAATSVFPAGRPDDKPHGLLVSVVGGRIVAQELPSAKKRILRKAEQAGDPLSVSLSPNGTELGFSYRPYTEDGTETYEIRVRGRDGSRERTLMTRFWANVLLWSPDSALLLVAGTDQYILDPEANLFWAWRPCHGVRDPVVLRWAADGRGLLILQRLGNDEGHQVVWRCDFDGRAEKVLVLPDTSLMEQVAIAPDERRVLVIDTSRLLLKQAGQESPQVVLSMPMPLDNLIVFWSPDGKWAGAAGQLRETKIPLVPDLILKNLETGAQRTIKTPPTLAIQWWAESPAPALDARAILRAALGPGKPFTPPLAVPKS
jgi:hypothetical protein